MGPAHGTIQDPSVTLVTMPEASPHLCVLIPALNEEQALGALLDDLRQQCAVQLEIIVSDGGSRDDTRGVAQGAGALVCQGPSGRGRQLNAGLALAQAPWLLVLHADSRICNPSLLGDALDVMRRQGPNSAGHFPLRFDDTRHVSPRLVRHMQRKSRENRHGCINGDQGLLLRREFLQTLGGFDDTLPFLEDQAISDRIFTQGRWLTLPGHLHTSARRFAEEGAWQRYFVMMLIMCAREAGLAAFFTHARQLYPTQDQARALEVMPFLDLILQLGEREADFWPAMARYARRNSWQLALVLDELLGSQIFLSWFDRHQGLVQSSRGDRFLGACLRALFRGPVRRALEKLEHRKAEPRP